MLAGGCSCGSVRYEADGPIWHQTICHCATCRRAAGAPMVAWFTVARDGFRLTAGAPARHRSSPHATRAFCGRCGTQLTFEYDALADEIDLTTCSLDDPGAAAPQDHTRTSSRLAWVRTRDGLPEYEETRPAR